MITDGIIGHAPLLRLFRMWVEKPANGYLLHGPPHLGKRTVAERFISALLGAPAASLNRAHPDLILLEREEGKTEISVKAVRDARTRAASRPFLAPRQVVYIPHADRVNAEGANALLKILEEPPAGAVFILVAEDASRFPETVVSRIVAVPFRPIAEPDIAAGLVATGVAADEAAARAAGAHGRPGRAILPSDADATDHTAAEHYFRASSFGERLWLVEQTVKRCDESDDPFRAWMDCLDVWMHAARSALRDADRKTARAVLYAADGICNARRSIGTAIPPRLALEHAAVLMDMVK